MTITNAGVHKETKQSEQNYLMGGGQKERYLSPPTEGYKGDTGSYPITLHC